MRTIVTGCAGFIGSNLVDRLLYKGHYVIGIDNISSGNIKNLIKAKQSKFFKFINADLIKINQYKKAFENIDMIYHFAANADVRFGTVKINKDLNQNIIVTHKILKLMLIYNYF